MFTDWDGTRFVGCREACVLVAYKDGFFREGPRKGEQRYSRGFGVLADGPDDVTTIEASIAELRAALLRRDQDITRNVHTALRQCEWNALSSLYYNKGSVAMQSVANLFNIDHMRAIKDFINWSNHEDPKIALGLSARRIREMMVALDGYYGDISKFKLWRGNPKTTSYEWVEFPALEEST